MNEQPSHTLPQEYLSSRDAARLYRVTNDYIARLCRQGKVEGFIEGRTWYVGRLSLERFFPSRETTENIAGRIAKRHGDSRVFYARPAEGIESNVQPADMSEEALVDAGDAGYSPQKPWPPVTQKMPFMLTIRRRSERERRVVRRRKIAAGAAVACALMALASVSVSARGGAFLKAQPHELSASLAEVPVLASFAEKISSFVAGIFSPSSGARIARTTMTSLPIPLPSSNPAFSTSTISQKTSVPAPVANVTNVYKTYATYAPAPAYTGVTVALLDERLQETSNALRSLIYTNSSVPNSLPASGGYTNAIALSQHIDSLNKVTISNATVDGVSGLKASEIPDLSASYLPLGGGTITGTFTVSSTTATSTFAGGINVTGGCIEVSGSCLSTGALTNYWTSDGTHLYNNADTLIGIGTTSPYAALSVVGASGVVADHYAATSTTATSTFAAAITVGAGQGTSTFAGGVSATYLNLTGTSATSTAANGINLTAGCFSVNGTCVSGGGSSSLSGLSDVTLTSPVFGNILEYDGSKWVNVATSTFKIALSDTTETLAETRGGTNQTSYATGDILYASNTNTLGKLAASTNGFVLALANGIPSWVASTTLSTISGLLNLASQVTGTLGISNGGTNNTSYSANTLLAFDGTKFVSTSTSPLYAGYLVATTSIASTFPYASTTAITATTASSTNLIVSSLGGSGSRCIHAGADGTLSATGSDCGSGGGGTGNVATSTNETSGNIAYWTTTSGSPATLGSDAGLAYSASAGRLTATYASSTAISSAYASSTDAHFGTLALNIATAGGLAVSTNGSVYEAATSTLSTISGTLAETKGGTNQTSYATGDILYASNTNTLGKLAASTNGFVLALANGIPSWVASTTLSTISGLLNLASQVTGTLGISNGGTNNTSYSANTLLAFDGTKFVSTSTSPLYIGSLVSTSTATSTFGGPLSSASGNLTVASAGTINSLLLNPYGGNVGVGTTSPWGTFAVALGTGNPGLVISHQGSTTPAFYVGGVNQNGFVGIGTTTRMYQNDKLVLYGGSFFQGPATTTGAGASDQTGMRSLGTVHILDNSDVDGAIAVSGRYAYSAHTNVFTVIDIADPRAPVAIASTTFSNPSSVEGVTVSGRYAYVEGRTSPITISYLVIVDISNPHQPTVISETLNSANGSTGSIPSNVIASGPYAYTYDSTGLSIFDVSNPVAPVQKGRALLTTAINNDVELALSGRYAYEVDDRGKLRILDVGNPSLPVLVSSTTITIGADLRDIKVSGRYAYVTDHTNGALKVIDVSDPTSPQVSSTLSGIRSAEHIEIGGRYAYVIGMDSTNSTSTISVVDISSPSSPSIASVYTNNTVGHNGYVDLELSGRTLYILSAATFPTITADLDIIDTSGIEVEAATIHSLQAGRLSVLGSAIIGNGLTVVGGAHIGSPGLLSDGAGAFNLFATTSLAAAPALSATLTDSNSSSVVDALNITHIASSTAANGIGAGLVFSNQDDSGFATSTARIASVFTDITNLAPKSALAFYTKNTYGTLTEWVRLDSTGNLGIGTTSPYAALSVVGSTGVVAGKYTATSTATSTFAGGLSVNLLNVTSTTASSTFGNGIDLTKGCFSINGTCISGGGSTNPGGSNTQIQFNNNSSFGGASNFVYITGPGLVGIGTTTPQWALEIASSTGPQLTLTGTGANLYSFREQNGSLYISTSSASTFATTTNALFFFDTKNVGALSYTAQNASATTTLNTAFNVMNALTVDKNGSTTVSNLYTGALRFDTDAGVLTAMDLPISAASSNTDEAYWFNIAASSTPNLVVYGQSDGSGGVKNQRIGIGTTTPWRTLSVNGTASFANLTNSTGANSLCLDSSNQVVYTSGDACTSSTRATKHDINALTISGLGIVDALQPVSFIYNWDTASTTHYGFIADDASSVDPHLGNYNAGILTGIEDRAFIAVAIKAIQEMQGALLGTASTTSSGTSSIAANFWNGVVAHIAQWLADAGNGIHDVYAAIFHAQEVDTQKLCVGDVCVTQTEFLAMVKAAGQSSSGSPSSSSSSTSSTSSTGAAVSGAPIIAVSGNNPARIAVGTTYNDLGATITGPSQDLNLGIKASVDGGATTTLDQVHIDTSAAGTHTVLYIVVDQAGLTGTATRTVEVYDPSATASTSGTATSTSATSSPAMTSTAAAPSSAPTTATPSATTDATSTASSSTTATSTQSQP